MNTTRRRVLALAAAMLALPARAASASPVGLWRYTDHATGRPKADIRVTEQDGALLGVIETGYPQPGDTPDRVCDKCPGDLKGHAFKGLPIMRGLHPDGDRWTGGTILDAESGDTYKCSLKVLPDGQHLEVRGYLGLSLFGRTETWVRLQ